MGQTLERFAGRPFIDVVVETADASTQVQMSELPQLWWPPPESHPTQPVSKPASPIPKHAKRTRTPEEQAAAKRRRAERLAEAASSLLD